MARSRGLGDVYKRQVLAMISFYFFSKLKEPNKLEKITPKPELENISNIPSKTKSILFFSCVFCYFFFVFMLNNQLPLILKMLNFNSALLGTLISCSGCGNVLSGSFSALCGKKYPMKGNLYELVLPGLLTALGFGVVALALYFIKIHTVLILCLIFFIIGIASARFSIATNVFTIKKFEHNIGVVSSQIQAVQNTAILFAPLLGAYILSNYTPKVLFLFASIVGIILFILIMISYKIQLRCKAS
jgi:MFS family permease